MSLIDGDSVLDFASDDDTFQDDDYGVDAESDHFSLLLLDFGAEGNPLVGLGYEALATPKYMKISKKHKSSPKVLKNLFLAQELNADSDTEDIQTAGILLESSSDELASVGSLLLESSHEELARRSQRSEVFVMEFSRDGKYLAAAGRDLVIKVWKVISSPLSRLELKQEAKNEKPSESKRRRKKATTTVYSGAPVFHQKPVAVFRGHTSSVIALDWSKNNFLVSGSMDRTAKLWHVDREDCLQTFTHEDFVTAVRFHPNDDRFFFLGSLDNHVRLWLILEASVSYSCDLGDKVLVTALGVMPDGEYCVAGGFNGSVFVLETKGLFVKRRFDIARLLIKHSFHNKNNNRVTGIRVYETIPQEGEPLSRWAALITTNDSKVRLVLLGLHKLVTRFKGLTNESASIVALATDDNQYIISGSEDHYCYVWENNNGIINNRIRLALKEFMIEGKHHLTDIHMHQKHRYARAMKNLVEHGQTTEYMLNENSSYAAFHAHHSKVNAAVFAPGLTRRFLELSDDVIFELAKRGRKMKIEDPDSAAGHVIVTTDQYGLIRVFRQDSAAAVRKHIIDMCKHRGHDDGVEDCTLSRVTTKKIDIPRKMFKKKRGDEFMRAGAGARGSRTSLYIEKPKNDTGLLRCKSERYDGPYIERPHVIEKQLMTGSHEKPSHALERPNMLDQHEKPLMTSLFISQNLIPASPSSAMFSMEGLNVANKYGDSTVEPDELSYDKRALPRIVMSRVATSGKEQLVTPNRSEIHDLKVQSARR